MNVGETGNLERSRICNLHYKNPSSKNKLSLPVAFSHRQYDTDCISRQTGEENCFTSEATSEPTEATGEVVGGVEAETRSPGEVMELETEHDWAREVDFLRRELVMVKQLLLNRSFRYPKEISNFTPDSSQGQFF